MNTSSIFGDRLNTPESQLSKEQFIALLKEVRQRGWVRSHRRRSNVGAVGNTLEDLLGIPENNVPFANAGRWELKTRRRDSSSLITLFHLEPKPRNARMVTRVLLPLYGWPHAHIANEMSFRSTTSGNAYTDRGFTVSVDREEHKVWFVFDSSRVALSHAGWLTSVRERVGLGPICPRPYWDFDDLEKKCAAKLANTVYVIADRKVEEKTEYFRYNEAWMLESFSFEGFLQCLEDGSLLVDFDARTGHNHGTKFRLRQDAWPKLYAKRTRVF